MAEPDALVAIDAVFCALQSTIIIIYRVDIAAITIPVQIKKLSHTPHIRHSLNSYAARLVRVGMQSKCVAQHRTEDRRRSELDPASHR